jgi:membrane associated rhomboid family serine protease
MRGYYTNPYYDRMISNRISLTSLIVIANICVFLIQFILENVAGFYVPGYFGLVPSLAVGKLWLWQFATYMFLHDTMNLFHILINMLILYMFGKEIEMAFGRTRFFVVYLACGVYAGICYCVYQYLVGGINYPVIGASGGVMGVLAIYALMWPNRIVLFFFIIPMKVWVCVLICVGIDLLYTISQLQTGVANVAHLGGAFCGFVIYKLEPVLDNYFSGLQTRSQRTKFLREFQLSCKVDAILDKINREGMASLSRTEKRILKKASKIIKK